MSIEYSPAIGSVCGCSRGPRLFRCADCMHGRVVCHHCLVQGHETSPFHWAEEWTGLFFRRIDLSVLGLKVFLGHLGSPCPNGDPDGCSMQVTDMNGIHDCRIVYCGCIDRDSPVVQLLKNSLFPATAKQVETAFTFRLLRDFHTLTTVAKTSAYDYMESLHRKTNNVLPDRVNVCILLNHFICSRLSFGIGSCPTIRPHFVVLAVPDRTSQKWPVIRNR